MQKCDEIFDFATPSSGGMAVISEKRLYTQNTKYEINSVGKTEKN